jgi:hypothetical protein
MSNYLSQIETEFSRGRGRSSQLSPLDWNLAQSWWDSGIPLHVVLGAMEELFRKHAEQKRKNPINSLRYFTSAVEQRFDDWKSTQVGKPIFRNTASSEENTMQNSSTIAAMTAQTDTNVQILDGIADNLMPDNFERCRITLPEPLRSAVARLRGEVLALLDDAALKQKSTDDIEARLTELRAEFELSLIVSVSEEERARIINETKAEYGKFTVLPDVEHKVLIRKLYRKFSLPELTLYAI